MKFEVINAQDNEYAVVIFAAGCAVVGLLAVAGDLALYSIRGESLLGLKHGLKQTPILCVAWAGGALIFGYLGQMIHIFQASVLACATVGTAWPIVFKRVIEKASETEMEQKVSEEERS